MPLTNTGCEFRVVLIDGRTIRGRVPENTEKLGYITLITKSNHEARIPVSGVRVAYHLIKDCRECQK